VSKLAMFDLTGKAAVITGGCSGLGLVFAEALAEAGANIAMADVIADTPQGKEAIGAVEKYGVKALALKCDVTKEEDVADMVAATVEEFGHLDILVNNAGLFGENKRIAEMSLQNWERVHAVDLRGSFLCARSAAREMMKQNSGKIINVSSASSFKAVVGMGAYASAKAAMIMLTKTLALELGRYNVQCNALCPGYFLTPLNKDFFESEAGQKVVSGFPMKRLGVPDELKGIMIFLASPASSYMTGASIVVDGGQWL
jgi:NAD(P)-dependent dehydrogenase (short-subunit alcohol dehydrogenase family)